MIHLLCIRDIEDKRYGSFSAGQIYNLTPARSNEIKGRNRRAFVGVTVDKVSALPPRLFKLAKDSRNRVEQDALVRV